MAQIINNLATFSIPFIILSTILTAICNKTNAFDSFIAGTKDGLNTIISILPNLIGLLAAISVFKASGILDAITKILSPIANFLQLPVETIPLAILRPLSGSASLAFLSETFQKYGPDSLVGMTASAMMGCTETILYTVAIYLGAAKIKQSRYAIPIAFLISIFSYYICGFVCKLLIDY